MSPAKTIYSLDEAAEYLGIGMTMLFELKKRGEIRTFRLGRRTLVHADDLDAFVRAKRTAA